jgi:MFS family permease
VLRLVQGVFVGGAVASTHTIGKESVALKYRGAVSGLIGGGGAGLGALLASLTYLAMSSLFPGDLFYVWGGALHVLHRDEHSSAGSWRTCCQSSSLFMPL